MKTKTSSTEKILNLSDHLRNRSTSAEDIIKSKQLEGRNSEDNTVLAVTLLTSVSFRKLILTEEIHTVISEDENRDKYWRSWIPVLSLKTDLYSRN